MNKIEKLEQIVEVEFLREIERNRDKINEIIDVLNSWIFQPTLVIPSQEKKHSRELVCMKCGSKKNLNTNKDKSFVECDKCMWGNGKSEKQPEEVLYEKFDEVVKKHEEYIADDYATYVGNPAVLLEDLRRVLLEYKSVKEKQLKVESEKQEEWREKIKQMVLTDCFKDQPDIQRYIDFIEQLLSERTFNKEELKVIEEWYDGMLYPTSPDERDKLVHDKLSKLLKEEE